MMKSMRMEMELDRISDLPDGVSENILSFLTLREAVSTSVLSTKWRNKWDKLQTLQFEGDSRSHQNYSFANIVDHVLLHHTGPVYKFVLSSKQKLASARNLDRWIFYFSKKHVDIRIMILDISTGDSYNIPSCLFSFQAIVALRLFYCSLNPPPTTFKGFKSLRKITFQNVSMSQHVFEKLIGCNPLLQILELTHCDGFTNAKIDAPKLWFIHLEGIFQDFSLVDSPNLVHSVFKMQFNVDQRSASSGNLIKFFADHPRIKIFIIDRCFLKYLSIGVLPEKLPKPCQYLSILSVDISFDDPDEISTVLCLLRSSPALQELHILVKPENDQAAVREVRSCLYDNYNSAHPRLRLVKLTKISCTKAQLDFIQFLLLSSPVLERMTVLPSSADASSKLVKDLLMLKRASKSAEIMLLDP